MSARLLCIEDDPDTRALLVEELEDAGYDVRAAADGADGLTEALSFRPDLILCDVMLPRLSGFDLLEKYGALVPNVPPFIFLTALTDRDNVL